MQIEVQASQDDSPLIVSGVLCIATYGSTFNSTLFQVIHVNFIN